MGQSCRHCLLARNKRPCILGRLGALVYMVGYLGQRVLQNCGCYRVCYRMLENTMDITT